MKQTDSPYWLNIALESEEAEDKLREAINACRVVHEWAMTEMRSKWTYSSAQRIGVNDLSQDMTRYLGKIGLLGKAQRFSLANALARAVSRFHQEMVIDMVGTTRAEVLFPEPAMPPEYRMVDIQSRSVWGKYLPWYGRISTVYGPLWMEDEWREVIAQQAHENEVKEEVFPYLVYSASIRAKNRRWQIHFNLHDPKSRYGKQRIKNGKSLHAQE